MTTLMRLDKIMKKIKYWNSNKYKSKCLTWSTDICFIYWIILVNCTSNDAEKEDPRVVNLGNKMKIKVTLFPRGFPAINYRN